MPVAFQETLLYLCMVFVFYEHAEATRACSYQRKDCCHGTQSSSAIQQHIGFSALVARLRDGRSEASTVLKYGCTPKFECGRSFEHSKLRLYLSLPETILGASLLQLYLLLRCGYTSCFAAAILLAASL